jgi:hypothetical protein
MHPVKVVKPTPAVSGSEAFLTAMGTSLVVRQLQKPLAADKARKREIASDACDVNRCVSTANIVSYHSVAARSLHEW